MATPKIFESEYRFCLILWEREPVSSAELAKICKEKLGWSRTTTYTVIHRLSERGVVKNEGGLVSSLVSKDEAQAAALQACVDLLVAAGYHRARIRAIDPFDKVCSCLALIHN